MEAVTELCDFSGIYCKFRVGENFNLVEQLAELLPKLKRDDDDETQRLKTAVKEPLGTSWTIPAGVLRFLSLHRKGEERDPPCSSVLKDRADHYLRWLCGKQDVMISDPFAFLVLAQREPTVSAVFKGGEGLLESLVNEGKFESSSLVRAQGFGRNKNAFEPVLATFLGHTRMVRCVAVDRQGELMASASDDKKVIIWRINTGSKVHEFDAHTDDVNAVAFHPHRNIVASGSQDNSIHLWDVSTGAMLRRTLNGHTHYVTCLCFTSNGDFLVSGSIDKTVILWDIKSKNDEDKITLLHSDHIHAVTSHPTKAVLVSGGNDKRILVWDMDSHTQEFELSSHSGAVHALAFNISRDILASGSADKTVVVWNVEKRCQVHTLNGHTRWVRSLSFHPENATCLISGSGDQSIRMWDVAKGREMSSCRGHSGVLSVCFLPTGD